MTFVLLQLLQFKPTHCIFINTALRGSGDYRKTFVAHFISTGPQRHRYQPKNAGWHISFWRSLVLEHLLGLHQSCQDKAFAEPKIFPEELKTSKTHTTWHKTLLWAPSLLNRAFHTGRKALKYCLQQNWHSIVSFRDEYEHIHAERPKPSQFGQIWLRGCLKNLQHQQNKHPPTHTHNHSRFLQLFRHKLYLSFPLHTWLPRKERGGGIKMTTAKIAQFSYTGRFFQ